MHTQHPGYSLYNLFFVAIHFLPFSPRVYAYKYICVDLSFFRNRNCSNIAVLHSSKYLNNQRITSIQSSIFLEVEKAIIILKIPHCSTARPSASSNWKRTTTRKTIIDRPNVLYTCIKCLVLHQVKMCCCFFDVPVFFFCFVFCCCCWAAAYCCSPTSNRCCAQNVQCTDKMQINLHAQRQHNPVPMLCIKCAVLCIGIY